MTLAEPEEVPCALHVQAMNTTSLVERRAVKRTMDDVGHPAIATASEQHTADIPFLAQVPTLIGERVCR